MLNTHGLPRFGVGYVRAIFSGGARGFVAPLDLLRGVLRGAARAAARARVAAAFAGYLVTDAAGPVVWRGVSGRVVVVGDDFCTGRELVGGLRLGCVGWAAGGGPLDAPGWLPGGAVHRYEYGEGAEVCAAVACVARPGLLDVPGPVFSARRGLYAAEFDHYCATSDGQVWGLGRHGWDWHNGALDAPDSVAAGGCVSCGDGGAGIGAVILRGRK